MYSFGKVKRVNPIGQLNALAGQERQDEIDKAMGDLRVEYLEHRHFNLCCRSAEGGMDQLDRGDITIVSPISLGRRDSVNTAPMGDVATNSRA